MTLTQAHLLAKFRADLWSTITLLKVSQNKFESLTELAENSESSHIMKVWFIVFTDRLRDLGGASFAVRISLLILTAKGSTFFPMKLHRDPSAPKRGSLLSDPKVSIILSALCALERP